jgi:arylsulfatase A-like enzyme/Tfp pilus assembly protein PilF
VIRFGIALFALGALAALLAARLRHVQAVDPQQNVLLVTIDTLRADALGVSGGKAKTPVLDALAAEGIRFTFAHAHVPLTLPSHASLLTGRIPLEHGVHDNSGFRVRPEERTLAVLLKARGLATAAFVSASTLDARLGLNLGFEVYSEGYSEGGAAGREAIAERRAEEVVRDALGWLRGQNGQWFCWVHLFDPHAPYEPPAPYQEQYAGRPYLGEVAYADAALAPLIEFARRTDRSTLILVTSDHGESLGEHGELTHGLFAYESTLHVPLILHQPRLLPKGRVLDAPVALVDVVPTVLALLGHPVPDGLAGRSLLEARAEEAPIYFEALSAMLTRGWAPLHGLLAGRQKYIELPLPEYYDLAADPAEQRNLIQVPAAKEPADELRAQLERLLQGRVPAEKQAVDPELEARLESLGYVTGRAGPKERYTESDDPKRLLHLDAALHQGIEHRRRGELDQAIALYGQILRERPSLGLVYLQLANVYRRKGELRNAIATLEKAVAQGLASSEARAFLGIYLVEAGQSGRAIELLDTCAEARKRGDADALNALGMALAGLGREPEALGCFQGVLELDPQDAMALTNTGVVKLHQGEAAEAEALLRRAVRLDPAQPKAWNALGVLAARSGRAEEAIAHWRRVVELDASQYDTLYNLGMLCLRHKDPACARTHLEAFARSAPPELYGRDLEEVRRILASL